VERLAEAAARGVHRPVRGLLGSVRPEVGDVFDVAPGAVHGRARACLRGAAARRSHVPHLRSERPDSTVDRPLHVDEARTSPQRGEPPSAARFLPADRPARESVLVTPHWALERWCVAADSPHPRDDDARADLHGGARPRFSPAAKHRSHCARVLQYSSHGLLAWWRCRVKVSSFRGPTPPRRLKDSHGRDEEEGPTPAQGLGSGGYRESPQGRVPHRRGTGQGGRQDRRRWG
jgi:hypothetical protein